MDIKKTVVAALAVTMAFGMAGCKNKNTMTEVSGLIDSEIKDCVQIDSEIKDCGQIDSWYCQTRVYAGPHEPGSGYPVKDSVSESGFDYVVKTQNGECTIHIEISKKPLLM